MATLDDIDVGALLWVDLDDWLHAGLPSCEWGEGCGQSAVGSFRFLCPCGDQTSFLLCEPHSRYLRRIVDGPDPVECTFCDGPVDEYRWEVI